MIKKNIDLDGTLLPSIINLTYSIPEKFLFHHNYKLRHPKIIANRSLHRIFTAFHKVLLEEKNILGKLVHTGSKSIEDSNISELIYELLSSILSYIEDCFHILKAGTPNESKKSTFVAKWLEKNNHPTYKDFYDSIKDYRSVIAYYVNEIKHNHGRIQVITSLNKEKNYLGYFISKVEQTDINETIDSFDLNSIKTLKTDLRYHLYQVYFISERLTSSFINASKAFFNESFSLSQHVSDVKYFTEVIIQMLDDKFYVFPPDIFSAKVLIKFDAINLELEYPYGVNEDNEKFLMVFKLKDEPYPENRIMLVPTRKRLEKLKTLKEGDKMEFIDTSENVYKLRARTEYKDSKKEEISKITIEYDDNFEIVYSSRYRYSLNFLPDLMSEKIRFYHFTNNR